MGNLKETLSQLSSQTTPVTELEEKREFHSVEQLEKDAKENILVNGLPRSAYKPELQKQLQEKGKKSILDGTPFTRAAEKHGFEICSKGEDGQYHYQNTKTGINKGFFPDGGQSYKNNRHTGKAVGYHPNGNKAFEQESFNAERKEYFENGKLRVKYPAVNDEGKWDGSLDIFNEQGELEERTEQLRTYMKKIADERVEEPNLIPVYDKEGNIERYEKDSVQLGSEPTYSREHDLKRTSFKNGEINAECYLKEASRWGDEVQEAGIAESAGMVTRYSIRNDKGKMQTFNCPESTPLPIGETLEDSLKELDSELVKNATRQEITAPAIEQQTQQSCPSVTAAVLQKAQQR